MVLEERKYRLENAENKMKVDINDLKSTNVEVKPEYPTVFPKEQPGYELDVIDHVKADCSVIVKKEECEDVSVSMTATTLDIIAVAPNVSNTQITPDDIKIKLDLGGDNDLSNSGRKIELDEQENAIGGFIETSTGSTKYNLTCESKCDVYKKNCKKNGILKPTTMRERYKCTICFKRFNARKTTLKHKKLHDDGKNNDFSGIFQRKDFIHSNKVNYKRDLFATATLQGHAKPRKYECEICNKFFTTKRILTQHVAKHTAEKHHKCEICNKFFTTKEYQSRHIKMHYTERNHKCKICDKLFATKHVLSRHLETHREDRNYKCDICDKSFTTKHNLPKHIKTHTVEKNSKCEICDKRFTTKERLSQHIKTHDGVRNHKCEICDKRFVTKQALSLHVERHSGERNHKCKICEKRFTTKQNLSLHLKTHTGKRNHKNHKCNVCDKVFSTKCNLSRHVETHAIGRNHKCEICDKFYTTKDSLSQHVKIHCGERNYKCETCDKRFTLKKNLSKHVKTHAGQRNYKCEICSKCFTRKQNLLRHVKMHSVASYNCEICDRRFGTKQSLGMHVKVHAEGNFKCELCNERYKRRKALLRHMKMHIVASSEENTFRNSPHITPITPEEIYKIGKRFIKTETDTFLTKDNLETNDTAERKSIDIKDTVNDDHNSTKVLNSYQTLHSEVIIKEEH